MELEALVQKIKSDVIDTDNVKGNIYYNGETSRRNGGNTLTFSYKFPQGKATEVSKYDRGDEDFDEDKANPIKTAILSLNYWLKENHLQIRVLKQSENSTKVEIYQDTKEIKKSSGDDLSHYIACSKTGISNPKESDDPQSFIRGHKEWLEAH